VQSFRDLPIGALEAERQSSYSFARLAAPFTPFIAFSSAARCFMASRSAFENPLVSLIFGIP
jgi:hypothetical protein